MTVTEAITNWVEKYRDRQHKLHVAGAIAAVIGSLFVLFFTWWALYLLLWFVLPAWFKGGLLLALGSWVLFGLLFVAYFTANYQELERIDIGPPGQVRKVKMVARLTRQHYMTFFANPETFHSFVKVLSISVLSGPALLMLGAQLGQRARQLLQIDPPFVAPFLIQLAKAGKRVPLEKLAAELNGRPIADLIDQMSLIDGVIVRTGETAGMYLTEELQSTLKKARDARKQSGQADDDSTRGEE